MGEKEKGKRNLDNTLLILASLFFYNKPIKGRTRLQKIIFLLKNKYGIPFDLRFRPYYYGPYSEELSDLVSLLRTFKFVEENVEHFGMGIVRYNYELTDKGKKYFETSRKTVGKEHIETIKKVRRNASTLSELDTSSLIRKAKSLAETLT